MSQTGRVRGKMSELFQVTSWIMLGGTIGLWAENDHDWWITGVIFLVLVFIAGVTEQSTYKEET